MRKTLALMCIALILLVGCDKKPKEPETPPPPPLPGQGEIYNGLRESVKFLLTIRTGFTQEDRDQTINKFRQALNENKADPTLYPPEQIEAYQEARKAARRQIMQDVQAQIKESSTLGGWRLVELGILCHKVLDPDNPRYDTLLEKARKMINMPKVAVKGNQEVDGEWHIFLEVDDKVYQKEKNTKKKETYTVRESETFHPNYKTGKDMFKLLKIIGDNLEFEIEYLEVDNHIFTVPGIKKR